MNIVVASRARVERAQLPTRPFALVSITDPGSSPAAVLPTPMLRGILRLAFDDAQAAATATQTGADDQRLRRLHEQARPD